MKSQEKKMEYIIDRIEGSKVVIYTGKGMITADGKELPDGIREGDVLDYYDGKYVLNKKLTAERKRTNAGKLAKLKNKKNK